jgi:hypothetical protein
MGDATYIHYVVFLTKHGMAPYREIIEINMPFAYLVERMAMATFGAGAAGWRVFDFFLIAVVITSCYQLLKNTSRAAGIFAGSLFAIVHGQDGVMMAGERDFVVAVCQLAALVCLQNSGILEASARSDAPSAHNKNRFLHSRFAFGRNDGRGAGTASCSGAGTDVSNTGAGGSGAGIGGGVVVGGGDAASSEASVISTGATASSSRSGEICCSPMSHTRNQMPWLFGFGFLSSAAMNLKPPAILFLGVTLLWLFFQKKQTRIFLPITAGILLPLLMSLAYLLRYGALEAFRSTLSGLIRYHSQIERKPLSFLLTHAFSPVVALCIVYFLIEILRRGRKHSPMEQLVALSAFAGWLSYCIQGKGFAYQRYPFIIFLLMLMSSAFFSALQRGQVRTVRGLGYAGLIFGLGMMFFFVHRTATYSHTNPYTPLSTDLESLGGASLSGSVQCMDTAGGCIASLYDEKLLQSTGFLYDCYLQEEHSAVALALRLRFEAAMTRNPPRLLIVTDSVCFAGKRSFDKFGAWPWFNAQLAEQYHLVRDRRFEQPVHYWSRTDLPFSYRIYEKN